ncbi:MAG TPA: tRNA (N(6)-L-threonylcarbamoyladenosine(37)-C(2))-methylthiotransferase MtaB, partial [Beijerinckiaceae bacterium]|nr:tRNA (N(6)-L-threonylcarbamoyladenosine(37)-C(2))-methylthiotransferase MtaB [Beijerinckiaceae bacterium]
MTRGARRVEVLGFGCRLNLAESAALRGMAEAAGAENLVVVNSCAVTSEAVRQARQAVRKVRRERPGARIVVTGCAAHTEGTAWAGMAEVDAVVANSDKLKAETWFGVPGAGRAAVEDRERSALSPLAQPIEGRTRGFVQVQTGCDHSCTFCIIPVGRGRSRSVPLGDVVLAVARLVDQGIGDVVLSGVDLTSYGTDPADAPRLGGLVKAILAGVPGLRRLRLSSLDCSEVDAELMRAIIEQDRLMPHLHLSLQAGDDLILKRMKRRHTYADAVQFCDALRRRRPDIVFGADLIAGFPTETEAMFRRSLDLAADCGLTHLHVFPFSPRPGTPAARMPQVERGEVRERAA